MERWAQVFRTLDGVRHIASSRGRLALERLKAPLPPASDEYRRLRENGILTLPGFYPAADCERAIAEFHRLEQAFPEHVRVRSDRRLFGANHASAELRRFAEHPRLVALAQEFYARPAVSCITLAAYLPFTENNQGSGEGWHRDSHRPQFKSILYLTDVTEQNGPFQIVAGSHRTVDMLLDTASEGFARRTTRLDDAHVASIVERRYPRGIDTITGPAGTLILVDTSAIHRGKPIEQGQRYALTNYYYADVPLPEAMVRHFSPLLPHV